MSKLICDGLTFPDYIFHSYKNVTPTADGLNQPDLPTLIQILINYYPEIFTQDIIQQIVNTTYITPPLTITFNEVIDTIKTVFLLNYTTIRLTPI